MRKNYLIKQLINVVLLLIVVNVDSETHVKIGDYPILNAETCGIVSQNPAAVTQRIVDGSLAFTGEFPFMATIHDRSYKLKYNNTLVCGASLIGDQWLLTAKHCVLRHKNEDLFINMGSIYHSKPYITYNVKQTFHHSSFDIGIVQLEQPTDPINPSGTYIVNTVCLPVADIINNKSEDTVVIGYGYTDRDGTQLSDVLRKANVEILSNRVCDDKYQRQPEVICSEDGDSGGPMIQYDGNRAVLIGVVNDGAEDSNIGCRARYLIFTRVSYFINMIIETAYSYTTQTTHRYTDHKTSSLGVTVGETVVSTEQQGSN
ncbi:mite allergen Der p 3-like [Oppia nitens]|uniref:mite allergen Der p 3-like n=1 Tax=Oppia nitens TaxID=1686743 RepID=UPI0023DC6934|nr:mite allergen Der p 3-like [Oppia nitens]